MSQNLLRRAWTYLEAIALVHQESLSFGGVSHLLGVLWHQWIEVGIVLLGYHPYTGTQVEVEELCYCARRGADGYVIVCQHGVNSSGFSANRLTFLGSQDSAKSLSFLSAWSAMGGDLDQNISFWQVKGGVADLWGRGHEGGERNGNRCAKDSAWISIT